MALLQASTKAMTVDGDPSCIQTFPLPDKNSSNIFGSDGNFLMLEKLRLDDEVADDEFFSSTSSVGRNSDDAEQSLYIDDSTTYSRYLYMENMDTSMKLGDFIGIKLPVESSNFGLLEKEEEIYDDNVVKESSIGIFKDGGFYVVKDICIDESIFNEKIMLEDNNEIHKLVDEGKIIDGRVDVEDSVSESIKPSSATNDHSSLILEKDARKLFESDVPGEKIEVSLPESGGDCIAHEESSSPPLEPYVSFSNFNDDLDRDSGQEKGDQRNLEEASFAPSAAISLPDTRAENNEKEGPCGVEAESGIITFDFNSNGSTAVVGRTQNREQPDHGIGGIGDKTCESETLPRSLLPLPTIRGDSSTSGPSFLCEPVASSGRLTFSGNISHRSDSSTTSACSFAFPVLQSEWNSSPVKMAKADRRRLRRRRFWKFGLFCCKS